MRQIQQIREREREFKGRPAGLGRLGKGAHHGRLTYDLGDQENDGTIHKTGKSGRRQQLGRQYSKFKLSLSSMPN